MILKLNISVTWDSPTRDCMLRCPCRIGLDSAHIPDTYIPDIRVMSQESLLSLQERKAVIDFDLKALLLAIEVDSPSIKFI